MATVSTAAYKTPTPAAAQVQKRDVADTVRDLFPASSILTALVARGEVQNGKEKKSEGMLSKREVKNVRFENYTYTPLAIEFTGSNLSSTTLTLTSTSGLTAYMTLVNTANWTTCRIDSVTNTTTLEVTSFGSSAFVLVTTADKLLAMAPAYPEYSSDPAILSKDEDNIYNVCQQVRFPVAISDVAAKTPTYLASDYWSRMKEINFKEGKRKVESMLLFSNRSSTNNVTAGGAALTGSFGTTRGARPWAANTVSMGNVMTPAKFRKEIPLAFSARTVNPNDKVICFAGSIINAQMQEWVNDRQIIAQDGTLKKFGLKSRVFSTAEFDVELVMHDLFNYGALANQMLLFVPDNLEYVYFTGKDLKPNTDIQSPSTLGFEDEFEGLLGIGTKDAGNSIMTVTECY